MRVSYQSNSSRVLSRSEVCLGRCQLLLIRFKFKQFSMEKLLILLDLSYLLVCNILDNPNPPPQDKGPIFVWNGVE